MLCDTFDRYDKREAVVLDATFPDKITVKIFNVKSDFEKEKHHYETVTNQRLIYPKFIVKCFGWFNLEHQSWGLVLDYYETNLER